MVGLSSWILFTCRLGVALGREYLSLHRLLVKLMLNGVLSGPMDRIGLLGGRLTLWKG